MSKTLRRLASACLSRLAPRALRRLRVRRWRMSCEEPEIRPIPYLCRPSKVSFDVGASLGVYTAHMLGYSKACYAFEPRPAAADELRKLFLGSVPPVCVEAVAVSDRAGTACLKMCRKEAGLSTVEPDNPVEEMGEVEIVSVPTLPLDQYSSLSIGCIKIDVEGHEQAVLRGAGEILRGQRPALIIEIEERHKPNAVQAVAGMLTQLGYEGFFYWNGSLETAGAFIPAMHQDSKELAKPGPERRYANNFVFVAREAAPGLMKRLERAGLTGAGTSNR